MPGNRGGGSTIGSKGYTVLIMMKYDYFKIYIISRDHISTVSGGNYRFSNTIFWSFPLKKQFLGGSPPMLWFMVLAVTEKNTVF